MSEMLFDAQDLPQPAATQSERWKGRLRLRRPVRDQVEFRTASLDQLLPPEHEARVVWEAVSQLDMSAWLDEVQAVEGHVGRNSTDPRLLLIYKLRAQTAEWVNALCRNRGLWQMPVRGSPKCRIVALLYAITHNLMQAANLRAAVPMMTN